MGAMKNPKKAGKGSKPKSTKSKVTNKNLNKFAKQGKLRKQRLKQKKKEQKQIKKEQAKDQDKDARNGDIHHGEEEEQELQEEDIDFYGGQDTAFVRFAAKSEKKKRKRKNEDDEDQTWQYEKKARLQFSGEENQNVKMLLPIKDKGRVIPQMVQLEEEEDDEEEMEFEDNEKSAVGEEKEAEPLPPMSSIELLSLRREKLAQRKRRIAELATALIENPQESMSKMKELRKLLGEKDPMVCLTVRKLVMVSLCEVFCDVIPGYRLRLPTEKEKEQRMKQDTKKLIDFESSLLLSYKTYLEYLEYTIKGKSFDSSARLKRFGFCDIPVPDQSKKELSLVAVQCMCRLLITHPHFNYRSDVVTFLVPLMSHKNAKFSDVVCQAVKDIFVDDKSGQVSLEIVRAMAKFVKSRKFEVDPKVLQTLLSLKIKEIKTDKTQTKKMERKEKFKTLSRRDRKRYKHQQQLEKDLEETKATQDKEERLRVHTQIVETMFTTFFNVLKQEEKSILLPVVLEALAKFTHLISVDYFHDIYTVFNKLIESGELNLVEMLHCVQTAFTILSGQGSALNIDPMKFYTHLYNALLGVHIGSCTDDAPVVLDCLEAAIIRRKKQVTQQRVLAFIKRMATMSLHQLPETAASYLAIARSAVSIFPYSDLLYDQEVEGSGTYNAYLEEPEHCHAHSTVLWELPLLRRHYHPDVQKIGNAMLRKTSDQSTLSRKTPGGVYEHIKSADIFPPSLPSKVLKKTPKKKGKGQGQPMKGKGQGQPMKGKGQGQPMKGKGQGQPMNGKSQGQPKK